MNPDTVTEETAPVIAQIDPDQLARVYIKIRDARAAATAAHEKNDKGLKDKMKLIENVLLGYLNDGKMESVRTESGTFYKQEDILPRAEDWGTLYEWIKENDAFDFLEKRIKKTEVKTYMDSHDNETPPGVAVMREWAVRVRRNNT
jgi:hypothetical protein